MGSEEFPNLFRIRNGVETMPSMLRWLYHADRMSVRGLLRGRFFFGCKIGALNFRKLFSYRKGRRILCRSFGKRVREIQYTKDNSLLLLSIYKKRSRLRK